MRKIYNASGNLFTLIAETDRVLCRHLVMFLTVFSTGCTKWNTAAIKILLSFTAGLFIGIWLRNAPLAKVIGNQILHGVVFVYHLAWCVRGLKSLKRWWLSGAESQLRSLSNYCIWCLFVSFSDSSLWMKIVVSVNVSPNYISFIDC